MSRIFKFFYAAASVACIAGCASTQYVAPETPILGNPEQPTMYDLESSMQTLVAKMLKHPQFITNYESAKSSKDGRVPVVVIGDIVNKTAERIQGRLDSAGDSVRSALFDSALFEVKDDDASSAITDRILSGADGGLEDSSLVQFAGSHESPDFIVIGDFRHFADVGGYHTYRLRLALHNLKTGKVVWEGIQTMVKL